MIKDIYNSSDNANHETVKQSGEKSKREAEELLRTQEEARQIFNTTAPIFTMPPLAF